MWNLWEKKTWETARGYVQVYLPEHPNASNGSVLMHRVVAENQLGRLLAEGEVVHHKNGNKTDNRPGNLSVISAEAHGKLHAEERPCHGETVIQITCAECNTKFERPTRNVGKGEKRSFCSRSCGARFNARQRWGNRPHGTYGRYRKGCRCDECRAANAKRCRFSRR